MKHADALAAVVAGLKALYGAEIPTFAIYNDEDGWHVAGPRDYSRDEMAEIFRNAATSCEEQMRPDGVALN